MVKAWVEHTSRLGGKTIRIFAGNVAKGDSEEKARERAVATIQEACDYAAKYGIYLALENHGGITGTADQLLAIVKAVKHDCLRRQPGHGQLPHRRPVRGPGAGRAVRGRCQIKTEVQPTGKGVQDADLSRLLDILRKANYRGYVALEYEAKEDAKVAVPRHLATLKRLIG